MTGDVGSLSSADGPFFAGALAALAAAAGLDTAGFTLVGRDAFTAWSFS